MAGANPLAASDYQPPDDLARIFAEGADAGIAGQINGAFDDLRDSLDIAVIAALLAAGGWIAVRRLFDVSRITDALRPATAGLVSLQNKVGALTMADEVTAAASAARPPVPPRLVAPAPIQTTPLRLTYDPISPVTVAGQREAAATLVTRITTAVESTIDQVIHGGLTNGATADELARTIKAALGLSPRQAMAVANFRRLLENGDAAALDRVLRDRRFDGSVQRAIDGDHLDEAHIDRMVARYAERYQAHRARTIARTETLRAANAGRAAAWAQYADRVGLDDSDVRRWWQTAHDERVCPVCSAIPLMNPDGVPLGQQYVTPIGPMMMPPDPHANCRCTERFEVARGGQTG